MKIACLTDRGRAREINEDSLTHLKIDQFADLIIVADGMGGHNAGEVASSLAVETIEKYIIERKDSLKSDHSPENVLYEAIAKANEVILLESVNDPRYSGMGTTVTAALIYNNTLCIGHVGDSRAYIVKNKTLAKITNDHSLVAELVKNGTITEEEAQHHPQKNIITRALGTENTVQVDIEKIHLENGDIILLCTDGLSNLVSDNELEKVLIENPEPEAAAKRLIDLANDLGGYDNITAIIANTAYPDCEVRE